jgi:hypothetical protein
MTSRTVSAFLPNGSYIDIAKVEGNATYKAYMLGLREDPTEVVSPRFCPFSQQICQYWPLKSVKTQNPLAPILKALIATAESTLETTINSAAVSAYDLGAIDYESAKIDVQTALSEVNVVGYNRLDHVARQIAPALGIRGNCSDPYILPEDPPYHHDPEQVFFTVEYTRDSLTAGLWREECGAMEMTKRLNSIGLGHDAMQTCRRTATDKKTCDETFKSALRTVSSDSSRDEGEEIGPVLVFGESADDDDMLVMLRGVLGEQFPNGDSMDLSRVRDFSPDPAFAGSRSMAKAVWAAHGSEYEGHHVKEL